MKLLFIGGCHDEKWEHVEKDQSYMSITAPIPKSSPRVKSEVPALTEPITTLSYIYHKESLRGEYQTFYVMVEKNISTDEWIKKLINGYKK